MKTLKTFALAGFLGAFALASDASACHKKKCACPTTTVVAAPAPVVVCAPAPVVACAPAKKHCFTMPKMKMPKMGCHKTAAPVCETVAYAAPVSYAPAPVYAAPQSSGQSSMQR